MPHLRKATAADADAVRKIFQTVVEAGDAHVFEAGTSRRSWAPCPVPSGMRSWATSMRM